MSSQPVRIQIAAACALAFSIAGAAAQSGGSYSIRSSTTDASGARATSPTSGVAATIAEPVQGTVSIGGSYRVAGGFAAYAVAATPAGDAVFASGFE